MSSIIFFFFFLAHSAVCCLIISLLWRFAGPPCIIYLCFSCVALFGPRVRGWNKADPHFEADRVSKVWTWGQHLPSLPAQPQPDRGRVRQRCSLLQASVGGEKHYREGYLVFLWPLKTSEMKRLSGFTRQGRPLQHRTTKGFKAQQNF